VVVDVSVPSTVSRRPRPRIGFWYRFIIVVAKPILLVLTRRDWRGLAHVPADGGVIIAANHVSELDPFAVGHMLYEMRRPARFLAKAELFRKAPVKWIVEGARQIPVSRNVADAATALKPAVDALRDGECVLIYPEGSVTRDPEQWPMRARTGIARLALLSGAPVVPVAQWGPQEVLPYRARRPRLFPRRTFTVVAGPPVDLTPFEGRPMTAALLHEATDCIMWAVTNLLADIRQEPPPARFFDSRPPSPKESS
jgi:1-acyl-sn-glycerol-3-phosphate acyltransferase